MSNQSNIQFTLVAPNNVPTPSASYYALFLSDGSSSTIAGVLYRKDSSGAVVQAQDTSAAFTNAKAQDAIGGILQTSDTVQLIYDTANRLISANIKTASIATTHLVDGAVTAAKLAPMADGTFRMRPLGAGAGTPVDGTAVQAKAALQISYNDVAGLGTAAQQPVTAFDAAGAASTAINNAMAQANAAFQPVDPDLTAIAALTTTTYGRSLLTVADVAALTALPNTATKTVQGMMAPTDKTKLDNLGRLGQVTATVSSGASGTYVAQLTAPIPGGLPAGTCIRIKLYGYATATGTVTFRIHAGTSGGTADTALWTSVASPSLTANQRAGFDGLLTMRTSSATATIAGEAHGYGNTTIMPAVTATPTGATVNTNGTWYVTLSTNISALGGFSTLIALVEAV